MSSSSLAARLRKILPFIGRNTASADRECYLRAFRRLYAEDPMAFSEVFDDELEKLRSEYPREITELIEQAGYAELDDQIVAAEREDGSVTTLYAAGFLAYGLENQALAAENLTREDAEKLKSLLLDEYFDESVAKIQIYEHLMPINHRAFVDAGESQRFLRQMMRSKSGFIPTFDSIDMPGIDYTLDEEDGTDIAARFRLILFTVRTPRGEKPALKRPFRFLGFATNEGKNAVLTSEAILRTRWGAELTALLSVRCGRGLRFCVTEPTLLNDTVRQLDYVTGLKRIMVVFTRTALDENVPPENLIVSLGAFSDPLKGYSELRVAFARPEAPDDLISGVPIPLPSGPNVSQAVGEIANMIVGQFEMEGIQLKSPIHGECPWLTAEPDTMDRLYNSIHNIQKPLRKKDAVPRPTMPSMMLN